MNVEIFKSESYQKILKHVIKFRYPELSFEQGLMKQLTQPSCLVIHKKDNAIYRQCELMILFTMNAQERYKDIDDVDRETEILTFISEHYTNIGRAITMCELCDVLNESYGDMLYVPPSRSYDISRLVIDTENYKWSAFNDFICIDHKTYYVHEQSQQTIDEIADLFD